MNNRERVLAVLNHEQPDKIPYNIDFTQRAHAKMVEFYGDPDFVSKLGNCLTGLSCEPKDSWKEVNSDIWEDQFGVQWKRCYYAGIQKADLLLTYALPVVRLRSYH